MLKHVFWALVAYALASRLFPDLVSVNLTATEWADLRTWVVLFLCFGLAQAAAILLLALGFIGSAALRRARK